MLGEEMNPAQECCPFPVSPPTSVSLRDSVRETLLVGMCVYR